MTTPPAGPVGPPPGWPGQTASLPPLSLPPLWQPGVIPLRPLSLSDIFNGAVGYVRANPKATLGLTTVVVMTATVIGFLTGLAADRIDGEASAVAGAVVGVIASMLATILLSGMLTAVVARAVRGAKITVGEAWRRVRGRMPALIALTLLEVAAGTMLVAGVALIVYGIARASTAIIAALVGVPLVLGLLAGLAYLYAALALTPVAIVLENKSVPAAIRRSLALCHKRFWRILGILLLAGIVAKLVSTVISVPFDIVGQVMSFRPVPATPNFTGAVVATIGQAIGGIITTPFVAGVVTLLYVDARIRSEAFDFALLSAPPGDPDSIWLHQ